MCLSTCRSNIQTIFSLLILTANAGTKEIIDSTFTTQETNDVTSNQSNESILSNVTTPDLPLPITNNYNFNDDYDEDSPTSNATLRQGRRTKQSSQNSLKSKRKATIRNALQVAATQGLAAMIELYEQKEPALLKKGIVLEQNHPGSLLSQFSAPVEEVAQRSKAAYATLVAAKRLRQRYVFSASGHAC